MAKTVKERVDQHDRQIAAIRNLVKQGMEMVLETRKLMVETRKDLRALAAAQNRTEANLNALIGSMRRGGGNGRGKQKIDIQ